MIPLRLILGVFEAGFFPGCVFLLSTWYSRYDVGKRYSVFYLIGCFASAASGILAYGVMQMNGLAGYAGWRWIFIMEGIITCLVGIGGYFLLLDFPDRAATKSWNFLGERECNFILRRVNKDRGDANIEAFSLAKFMRPALDPEIWGFALIFFCLTTVTYSIAYFLPIILREGMGFSIGAAQCLVAPPYAFAGIVMFCTAWVGDKYHVRGPILAFNACLALIGLPIMVRKPDIQKIVFMLTQSRDFSITMRLGTLASSSSQLVRTPIFPPAWRTRQITSAVSGSVPSAVRPLSDLVALAASPVV